jgi:dsRNA-specific ribonuclease
MEEIVPSPKDMFLGRYSAEAIQTALDAVSDEDVAELESRIRYEFSDKRLAKIALCDLDNERLHADLENIGDAYIKMHTQSWVERTFVDGSGRQVAWRMQSNLFFSIGGTALQLYDLGRKKTAIVQDTIRPEETRRMTADFIESITGAILLDTGTTHASRFLRTFVIPEMKDSGSARVLRQKKFIELFTTDDIKTIRKILGHITSDRAMLKITPDLVTIRLPGLDHEWSRPVLQQEQLLYSLRDTLFDFLNENPYFLWGVRYPLTPLPKHMKYISRRASEQIPPYERIAVSLPPLAPKAPFANRQASDTLQEMFKDPPIEVWSDADGHRFEFISDGKVVFACRAAHLADACNRAVQVLKKNGQKKD